MIANESTYFKVGVFFPVEHIAIAVISPMFGHQLFKFIRFWVVSSSNFKETEVSRVTSRLVLLWVFNRVGTVPALAGSALDMAMDVFD